MNDYLLKAARVVSDPEQTSEAKVVATQILRNAGFSNQDIATLNVEKSETFVKEHMIFLA
ncbi:hypothetical protein DRW07_09500 [Alteromonas sediminis]|uniref:Uncharacterized protein n=1 Tax=Alteromonas sediminis TaxID=2259342 RepID=A0A3N5YM40_9ALTE|nr:hypothetical protein [Alteromonas sediminis]RPJ66321.1 hypothetical protein DRW07_09500 [Alteromonas sediminis]